MLEYKLDFIAAFATQIITIEPYVCHNQHEFDMILPIITIYQSNDISGMIPSQLQNIGMILPNSFIPKTLMMTMVNFGTTQFNLSVQSSTSVSI